MQVRKWGGRTARAAALALAAVVSTAANAMPVKFTIVDGVQSGSFITQYKQRATSFEWYNTTIPIINATGFFAGHSSITMFNYDFGGGFRLNGDPTYRYYTHTLYGESYPEEPTLILWNTQLYNGVTANPTLVIAPYAPGPVAGGGLVAAIAAVLGLLATRGRTLARLLPLMRRHGSLHPA